MPQPKRKRRKAADNPETREETETMSTEEIVFVDELPKIERQHESGVWAKRLAQLRERPDTWARVFGPTNSPHAQISNIRNGLAAGVDPDEFDFAGRMVTTDEVDEDGKPVKEGYVFAKYVSDENERAELKRAREERAERARASREARAKASADA